MAWRIFTSVIILFVPSASHCAVFDHDDRIPDTASNWPVGIVGDEWFTYGSGFLIDRCTVLTARHVVGSGEIIGRRKRFRLQPWRQMSADNTSRGTVVEAGNGAPGSAEDWAKIKLDRCLGDRFGFFPIADVGFYKMGRSDRLYPNLVAMGYPTDRGRHTLSIDPNCQAKLRSTRGLLVDCAVMPGASGGPILAWSEIGKHYEAFGMTVAGIRSKQARFFILGDANIAVDLTVARHQFRESRDKKRGPSS